MLCDPANVGAAKQNCVALETLAIGLVFQRNWDILLLRLESLRRLFVPTRLASGCLASHARRRYSTGVDFRIFFFPNLASQLSNIVLLDRGR